LKFLSLSGFVEFIKIVRVDLPISWHSARKNDSIPSTVVPREYSQDISKSENLACRNAEQNDVR
jgi:hypothetical protein